MTSPALTSKTSLLIMTATLLVSAAWTPAERNDMDAVRKAMLARWEGLRGVVAKYDREECYTPTEAALELEGTSDRHGTIMVPVGSEFSVEEFRYLDGRLYFEKSTTEQTIQSWKDRGVAIPELDIIVYALDPDLGYGLVSYALLKASTGDLVIQITNSEFVECNEYMLPRRIVREQFSYGDGEPKRTQTSRIHVRQYAVNSPDNTPEKYRILWPAGTRILDDRSGKRFRARPDGTLEPRNR
ncbi:MAG: hypothetical protein JW993_18180 [Sedimentisphaerales bacterium]|nr:hypothetical protein [Sedimentisphaerales bacterium]